MICDTHYRFSSKEAATEAIVGLHLTEINGHTVKCSWGKKGDDNVNDLPPSSGPHSPVSSTLGQHSTNTQLATDYCQLTAQSQLVSKTRSYQYRLDIAKVCRLEPVFTKMTRPNVESSYQFRGTLSADAFDRIIV